MDVGGTGVGHGGVNRSRAGLVLIATVALVALGPTSAARAGCPAAPAGYATYSAPSATPKFTVPSGVTRILTCVIGGRGGDFDGPVVDPGGFGSMVTATLTVSPGDILQLSLGGNGQPGTLESIGEGGIGPVIGYNGGNGGKSNWHGGAVNGGGAGGGGASAIQSTEGGFDIEKLVIAGGGGGGGADAVDYTEIEGGGIFYGSLGGGAGGSGGTVSGNEAGAAGTNGGSAGETYYNGEDGGSGGGAGSSTNGYGGNRGADRLTGPPQCGEDGTQGSAGHEVPEQGNGSGGAGGKAGFPGTGSGPVSCNVVGGKGTVPSWGGGGGGGAGTAGGGGGGGGAGGSDPATPEPVEGGGGGGGGGGSSVAILRKVKGSVHYATDDTGASAIQISYAVARVAASPSTGLTFAPQTPAAQSVLRVTLTNSGAAPLMLGAPGISGEQAVDFRVAADTCSTGEVTIGHACYYDVAYSRLSVGESAATLAAHTNDETHPTIEVPLRGSTVVAAAPAGGGPALPPPLISPLGPPPGPQLSGLHLSRSAFPVTATRRLHGPKPKLGAQLHFNLSEPATVSLTLTHRLSGHLHGGRCLVGGSSGRRCTITRGGGTIRLAGKAGANQFAFPPRTGAAPLAAGAWSASVVARDSAGRSSPLQQLTFTVT